jgi:hypothetical protein
MHTLFRAVVGLSLLSFLACGGGSSTDGGTGGGSSTGGGTGGGSSTGGGTGGGSSTGGGTGGGSSTGGGTGGGASDGGSGFINTLSAAPLSTKADGAHFNQLSAPQAFAAGVGLVFLTQSDAGCPVVTDDGTTMTATGGCTTQDGNTYGGAFTMVRTSAGAQTGTITYNGFSITNQSTCSDGGSSGGATTVTLDGTAVLTQPSASQTNFTVDLQETQTGFNATTCATGSDRLGWNYAGSAVSTPTDAGSTFNTWNGSGKFGIQSIGLISATTVNEVVDSAICGSEAASGTTTVTSGRNSMVITYDGASKCDQEGTVLVSINGTAQGEYSGVSCASAPGLGSLALALGVMMLLRRRA